MVPIVVARNSSTHSLAHYLCKADPGASLAAT